MTKKFTGKTLKKEGSQEEVDNWDRRNDWIRTLRGQILLHTQETCNARGEKPHTHGCKTLGSLLAISSKNVEPRKEAFSRKKKRAKLQTQTGRKKTSS